MSRPTLARLAERAGIAVHWEDFRGRTRKVAPDSLRRLLAALELPCETAAQLADSHARFVASERPDHLPPLLTATCGEPIALPAAAAHAGTTFRVIREDGGHHDGRLPQHAAGTWTLPPISTPGYHRLHFGDHYTTLAVAPRRCTSERDLRGDATDRPWGLAAQLYGLRMRGDGGIGTYRALGHLAARLARDGAAALAVSPVHAMFSAEPAHRSPYSPSSRLLLNALHIDAREVFGDAANQAREALGLGTVLAHLEAEPLIDWGVAGGARLALLRFLHDEYFARDPKLVRSLARFRTESGGVLEDHARFEALHAHFHAQRLWSWRDWPAAYRDPGSDAVERFAQDHAETVRFHAFLQWLAARGLDHAQQQARTAGMPIGLIADLAIGSDPNGSHVWSRQHESLVGVSIGAPPDPLAMRGQSWGLAALSPTAMRDSGFRAFIELLRATMVHAGGIRIDHVMGLMRLWLVPDGGSPLDGAYLAYPKQDLLRLVALESWRHRCLVIGEDLGTVPRGFSETLADGDVLGLSVLWFERDGRGGFLPAHAWRRQSVAMTTTHDLPTVAGWWLGQDIKVRQELGLLGGDADVRKQQAQRESDRNALWATLHADVHPQPPRPDSGRTAGFVEAAIGHVARTPTALALVPVEDVLGLKDAPNVPGTSDEHPNWRRRLPADIDTLLDAKPTRTRLQALDQARRPFP